MSTPAEVDAVTVELASLSELPVAEHPDVFDRIHRSLHDALADLDER